MNRQRWKISAIYYIHLLLLITHALVGGSMSTPQVVENNNQSMSQVPFSCFNPTVNKFFTTWSSNSIYGALYNPDGSLYTSRSIVINDNEIPAPPIRIMPTCYNPQTKRFLIGYDGLQDFTHRTFYKFINDNGEVVLGPNPTNNQGDNETNSVVFSCYNNIDNVYVMSWGSVNSIGFLAIINADGTIALNSSSIAGCSVHANSGHTVFVSHNTRSNRYLFTWQDQTDATPWHTIYESNNNNPLLIRSGALAEYVCQSPTIANCYNSTDNVWFITWTTNDNQGYFMTIDEDGNEVTPPTKFSDSVQTIGSPSIYNSYNPTNNTYFITWQSFDRKVMYAICSITESITIETGTIDHTYATTIQDDVLHAYDNRTNSYLITWRKQTPNNGYYAIFRQNLPEFTEGIKAERIFNRFARYGEYFNRISWNPTSISNLAGYKIYRNGTFIAWVNPEITSYEDHNQLDVSTQYSVKAVNSYGAETDSLTISV